MRYKLNNGLVVDRISLNELFPSYQIPDEPTVDDADFLGVELVYEVPPPAVSSLEVAVSDGVELVDGKLYTKWRIEPLPAESYAQRIADLKREKNSAINSRRLAANASTFNHQGHSISCDALSRGDIDGIAMTITITGAFPPNFPGVWKTASNDYIPMETADDFRAMYASMSAQGVANFAKSEALKTLLASATTAEEISSITWE